MQEIHVTYHAPSIGIALAVAGLALAVVTFVGVGLLLWASNRNRRDE